MDNDPNAVLNDSFNKLESAFSDESRRLVRAIKYEWQKILNYKEEILSKQEQIVTANQTLVHLNDIKAQDEKYIRASESRIEHLKMSNEQLKSKLSILRREDERVAKTYEEHKTHKKKIDFFTAKWNQKYETHYFKNPKIKEKEQAIRELEQAKMKSCAMDEELRKYERKLFQAKCEKNRRAIEESKLHPFKSFVVNIAKIYLKTLKENNECHKLKKEMKIAVERASVQKETAKVMPKHVQLIQDSNMPDDDRSNNEKAEQAEALIREKSRQIHNDDLNQDRENMQKKNLLSWNKGDKVKSLTEKFTEQSLLEKKKFPGRSPLLNKWMEKYKIYIPNYSEPVKETEPVTIASQENKKMCIDSPAMDYCHQQSKFSVFDSVKDTRTVGKETGKFLNYSLPKVYKSNMEDTATSASRYATITSKLALQSKSNEKENIAAHGNSKEHQDSDSTKKQKEQFEPMELEDEGEMHIARNATTLQKDTNIQNCKANEYFNPGARSNLPNINQLSTPQPDEKNEFWNEVVPVQNVSQRDLKNNVSSRCIQVLTGVVSPITKDVSGNSSIDADCEQNFVQNDADAQEVQPMDVDTHQTNIDEANAPINPDCQVMSRRNSDEQNNGAIDKLNLPNQHKINESKYFRAVENKTLIHPGNELETGEKICSESIVGSKDPTGLENASSQICDALLGAESQKNVAHISPTPHHSEEHSSPTPAEKETDEEISRNKQMPMKNGSGDKQIKAHEDLNRENKNVNEEIIHQNIEQHFANPEVQVLKQNADEIVLKSCSDSSHYEGIKSSSSRSQSASEYVTPTSNFGTDKTVEAVFKTPTKIKSPKSAEKAAAHPKDSPQFLPFDVDNVKSPGFTYSTRPMFQYQPSTSKAKQEPHSAGGQINMFELSSFFGAENIKASTQSKDLDEDKSDFLISAYEEYLTDSPPITQEGNEKPLFAFNDIDSPEEKETGGFFPLFVSEAANEEKNEASFNFNFGETSGAKSPEDNEFKFLF